jgi:hypothetical protein
MKCHENPSDDSRDVPRGQTEHVMKLTIASRNCFAEARINEKSRKINIF